MGEEGPVFRAPWEAQAFAMAIALHERGLFTWPEWAAELTAAIRDAQVAGDPDTGATYYEQWMAALERLCLEHHLTTGEALEEREHAWARAAAATPHGKPILLENDPER